MLAGAPLGGADVSSLLTTSLAATTRREALDASLLRPGRIEQHISVPLPDFAARVAILEHKFLRMPVDGGLVEIEALAGRTAGCSGTVPSSSPSRVPCLTFRSRRTGPHLPRGSHGSAPRGFECPEGMPFSDIDLTADIYTSMQILRRHFELATRREAQARGPFEFKPPSVLARGT